MLTPSDIIITTTAIAGENLGQSTLLAYVRPEAVAREALDREDYAHDVANFTAHFPVMGDLHVECPNHDYPELADLVRSATDLPEFSDLVGAWIDGQGEQ